MNSEDKAKLLTQLEALKREFVGFPKEQETLDITIQALNTPPACSLPKEWNANSVSASLLLAMARVVGSYCTKTPCEYCLFKDKNLSCPASSWRIITDETIQYARYTERKGE